MGLFSRKRPPEAESIAAFWRWWRAVRDDVAAAIGSGTVADFASEIASHLDAVNPGLQWELTKGTSSSHALVVTSGGSPALRATAARLLAAAPPADETWSYQSTRLADPAVFESTMVIGGEKLELAQIRYAITVDQETHQIDVMCHHPAFVNLPDEVQGQVTFLTLDWALGEDAVETWLGVISWTSAEPSSPKTPRDLRNAVAAVSTDDSWVLMQGQKPDGKPIVAMAAAPLRSARWPRLDLHVPVTVPYQRYNEVQLPQQESLEALRGFEDELAAAIGHNGAIVAHETSAKVRTLHFYVDSQTNAAAELESNLARWAEGRATARQQLDPGFERVSHLMR